MKYITDIVKRYGINSDDLELYGNYIAKLKNGLINNKNKFGKLILVSAINPITFGEGKTTISISLTDALNRIGKKAIVALREPSIGPCFGLKGGATGGGKASIIPCEQINLHFTGDIHAITTANNLISAIIDNEIYQKSNLRIDPKKIIHARCLDMNDRSLRQITLQLDKNTSYKSRFDITSACELMTILCLAKNKNDFVNRLNSMVVAYDYDNKPVTVRKLKITNVILAIMDKCFYPNIVQTKEGNMALIHGGPFANISVGVSSFIATTLGLNHCDYLVTEAGFGSDLGAEKFLNILCQQNKIKPACIVLVVTIKSIFLHGNENFNKGLEVLSTHINHLKHYNIPFIIAINQHLDDNKIHLQKLISFIKTNKIMYSLNTGALKGSIGSVDLANKVITLTKIKQPKIKFLYKLTDSLEDKIVAIVQNCYGLDKIIYSPKAKSLLKKYNNKKFYVCISKQPNKIPTGFINNKPVVCIKDMWINYGSKLIIVLCDKVFRMPGLPKNPLAKSWK